MNSTNSKAPDTHRLLIDLSDGIKLKIKWRLKWNQDTILNF